ncbi:MAG TPA: NADH-quinone oxidoreductase subunit C [Thermoanaerobaculia bacterium]|nr:NADH-quinone oxidoreductase subunit C [Thermoanaerobaculia bacterium]
MTEEIEPTTAEPAQPPPVAAAAPAGRTADAIRRDPLVSAVVDQHSADVTDAREFAGEVTLHISRERIREVCQSFKSDGFGYLVDLTGVDYSTYPNHGGERFAVVYHLYSHSRNARVRLKVFAADGVTVPSVTPVWKTANWHERETFDMYGIVFEGHPNLERILMWEGFNGHPLRKDFPLRGIDTGARIYPEVFPEGGGPKAGSTGKDPKDVNLYSGEWDRYGRSPIAQLPATAASAGGTASPELATQVAASAQPTEEAPFHDPDMPLPQRMELAKDGDLKTKLFAAMAQTDCTACGWDCEGYAAALATGESKDITLCVPGEAETESMLKALMTQAGKL